MPIYEYRCRACDHEFEVIQRHGERARRKCMECGGRLEKLVSRTSFQLKGGGWYAHGYGDSSASSNGSKRKRKAKTPAGSSDSSSSSASSASASPASPSCSSTGSSEGNAGK